MAENKAGRPSPSEAIVVTGATGGIGTAIIEMLWHRGEPVEIIGACRRPERMYALANRLRRECPASQSTLTGAWLDLSTTANARRSAAALSAMVRAKGLKIRALVNNAGTMPVNRLEVNDRGCEMTLQVNCISTIAFTTALLDDMLTPGGVIVMTSSVMRHFPRLRIDFDTKALRGSNIIRRFNNYGRSKQLLTLAARDMANKYADRGIRVNCADPGVVNTGIIRLGYDWVDSVADTIARPLMKTPARGAVAALRAIDTPQTAMMATEGGLSQMQRYLDPAETAVVSRLQMLAR